MENKNDKKFKQNTKKNTTWNISQFNFLKILYKQALKNAFWLSDHFDSKRERSLPSATVSPKLKNRMSVSLSIHANHLIYFIGCCSPSIHLDPSHPLSTSAFSHPFFLYSSLSLSLFLLLIFAYWQRKRMAVNNLTLFFSLVRITKKSLLLFHSIL